MRIKVVTFTDKPNHPGFLQLKRSMDHFAIDYHVITGHWKGFGTKIIETANYVRTIQDEYTHFIFVDAHDTFFLSGEFDELIPENFGLVNAEKGDWPRPPHPTPYPEFKSEWRYLNSGVYSFPIPLYLKMVEQNPINYRDDDQGWLRNIYLTKRSAEMDIRMDTNCDVFQSIAFRDFSDFEIRRGSLYNLKTKTTPVIIHNNGGNSNNPMHWIYNLLP